MFYTYLLGWSEKKKYYYGVRYSKKAKIEDVGTTYLSSSKYVKLFIEKHGMPDIIEIRKIFTNKDDALKWETKFLKRIGVPNNPNFLNRWNNNMVPKNLDGPFPFEFKDIQDKINIMLIKKYGGRGSASNIIKQKVYQTNLIRYGTHHTLNIENVKKAREEACVEKYGVSNPFNSIEFQASLTNPMKNPIIREKHKQIMKEKDWTKRNEKSKNTNLEKYGVSNPMNRPEVIEKNRQECPFCSRIFNSGGFSLHMTKIHCWTKEQIRIYKDEKQKNTD